MSTLKAVIFDMDGVLLDSEQFICDAAILMFREQGLEVHPEDFIPFVGSGEDRYLGGVAENYEFPFDLERDKARTYELYNGLVQGNILPLPGVAEFLKECDQRELRMALATSADRVKMEINLREIEIPPSAFAVCLTGSDVANKKPDPEIFQTAATKLGFRPAECLVIEDAINGVRAAKAAGARCLGLTTSFTDEDLQLAGADWSAANLAEAPPEALDW